MGCHDVGGLQVTDGNKKKTVARHDDMDGDFDPPRMSFSPEEAAEIHRQAGLTKLPAERFGRAPREPDKKPVGRPLAVPAGRRGQAELPDRWTIVWVMDRLEEAAQTLARVPMSIWPRSYANTMPAVAQESIPLIDMFDMDEEGELQRLFRERNQVRRTATSAEITRMNQALAWPLEYLRDQPDVASAVGLAALWSARNIDMAERLSELDIDRRKFFARRIRGLKIINAELTRRRVPVS